MPDPPRTLPMIQPAAETGSPPIFEKVAIIGLGLIGGSIALAVRQHWPSSLVIGLDRTEVLEKAMVLHAIDVAADDPVVIAEADLVILAAPVEQNIERMGELDRYVTTPAVVTDVGSTKRTTVEAARTLPSRFTFVGGHPLGGAPRGGIEYARPDLFVDRPWLFTPEGDAAAAVVITSRERAERAGLTPLARFVTYATAGVEPERFGVGPVPAIRKALKHAGLTLDDIDLVELNEAFAAQVLACLRELPIDPDKLNVNGGAIALGHPLGCTGAKLTTSLLYELERRQGRYGLVTMCVGGGMGAAGIFERLS